MMWSRQRRGAYGRREITYRMPVEKDCSNLPSNSAASEISSSNKTGNQIVGKQSQKLTSRKKIKHKILIIGDSHGRECASNVKYNLENDFEVQGVINPGAGLKDITNSVKKRDKTFDKERCSGCVGWYK
jgi:hypothetical protein